MGMIQISLLLQFGHDVPYGGRTESELEAFRQGSGTHGKTFPNVKIHHRHKDLMGTMSEFHGIPLN
jgi:hypothetical protein